MCYRRFSGAVCLSRSPRVLGWVQGLRVGETDRPFFPDTGALFPVLPTLPTRSPGLVGFLLRTPPLPRFLLTSRDGA